jgi:hypothetical protein
LVLLVPVNVVVIVSPVLANVVATVEVNFLLVLLIGVTGSEDTVIIFDI